jgi:hypothetical protein
MSKTYQSSPERPRNDPSISARLKQQIKLHTIPENVLEKFDWDRLEEDDENFCETDRSRRLALNMNDLKPVVLSITKPKRRAGDDYSSYGKDTKLSKKSKERDESGLKQYDTYELENRSILGGNDIYNAGYATMMRKEEIKRKEAREKRKVAGEKMSRGPRSRMGGMSTVSGGGPTQNISPSVRQETLMSKQGSKNDL